MSWRVIAKRVVLDPYRSRYLWVELGVIGLFFGFSAYFQVMRDITLGAALVTVVYVFVSLVAIARSYGAIANRRQNGSLRVILAYPHSRRAIVIGTTLGRSLVLIATVSFGFVVAFVVFFVRSGSPPVLALLLHSWLAALLLGVTVTWLTVGISAGSRTTNRAALMSFTALILFFGLWDRIPDVVHYFLNGTWPNPMAQPPEWAVFFSWLNPFQAYFAVAGDLVPRQTNGVTGFYATEWFGGTVLLVWGLLSLVLGYWQLERSDL